MQPKFTFSRVTFYFTKNCGLDAAIPLMWRENLLALPKSARTTIKFASLCWINPLSTPINGIEIMKKITFVLIGYLFSLVELLVRLRQAKKTTLCSQKLMLKLETDFPRPQLVSESLLKKKIMENLSFPFWMIVTANPYATDVGSNILQHGGTAADAMVAVQAMGLFAVDTQSSGMGGGGFLVWYDSKSGELTTLDAWGNCSKP